MKVSVVVITYNQQATIARCLDSIIANCSGCDCEIIVGDDASSDSTPDIVRSYATRLPKLIMPVIRTRNVGAMANFYDLISLACGDVIMWCAGDDSWLPGKMKRQLDFLAHNPDCGLLYGKARMVAGSGEPLGDYKVRGAVTTAELMADNDVPAPTVATRRSELMRYMAEVDPAAKSWICEDWPMLLWFSLKSKICYLPEYLAEYRMSPTSATHSPDYLKNRRFTINDADIRLYFINNYNAAAAMAPGISAIKAIAVAESSVMQNGGLTPADRSNLTAAVTGTSAGIGLRNRLLALWLRLAPRSFVNIRRQRYLRRVCPVI